MSTGEKVRLLIWDLDDTFWNGTLEEGGATLVQRNIDIVKRLTERGIINSICSKNHRERVHSVLARADIGDYFVFPRIAFEAKGAMVASIIESAQLRAESIMFIDDNPINLNEVAYYNPGIQLATPDILENILDDPRFLGKDDRQLSRLEQYKVLEQKEVDRSRFADGGKEFLRLSEVSISFHYDSMAEFTRIHELINRTNQMNYTKNRLPEDPVEARSIFEQQLSARDCHAGYIKVSDKYGAYGICGFYMTKGRSLVHFLFSCRILNMGIEQFIYQRLIRPTLKLSGEVASDPRSNETVDWITVVEDADERAWTIVSQGLSVCVRGGCELDQMTHYVRHLSVKREFPFPFRGWGIPIPLAQYMTVFEEIERPENAALPDVLPGLTRHFAQSQVFSRAADAYVLSFALEPQWGNYRFNRTGLILPLRVQSGSDLMSSDLTQTPYDEIRRKSKIDLGPSEWQWFRENFEYVGHFDPERFATNVRKLLGRLTGKTIVIIQLNTKHGGQSNTHADNAVINEIVRHTARRFAVTFIDLDELIHSDSEVLDADHFVREVYLRLANRVTQVLDRAVMPQVFVEAV